MESGKYAVDAADEGASRNTLRKCSGSGLGLYGLISSFICSEPMSLSAPRLCQLGGHPRVEVRAEQCHPDRLSQVAEECVQGGRDAAHGPVDSRLHCDGRHCDDEPEGNPLNGGNKREDHERCGRGDEGE